MTVTLYTTHCPKCKILEKKLQLKKIKYEEVNDVNIMKDKGFLHTPMLETNHCLMNFTEAVEWINKL